MSVAELVAAFGVSGDLLGSRVVRTLGHDLDIIRFAQEGCQDAVIGGKAYAYVHSSLARRDGHILGRAKVFWGGLREESQMIVSGRMKDTLHRLGYSVLTPSYNASSSTLSRVILAPRGGAGIAIMEVLCLSAIDTVLNGSGLRTSPRILHTGVPALRSKGRFNGSLLHVATICSPEVQ